MGSGLTPKQLIFVGEYLKDKNATRAAKAAGYSKKTARSAGSRLLTIVDVQAAIAQKLTKAIKKADLTAEMVLAEIRRLAFVDLSKAFEDDGNTLKRPQDMPRDIRAALNSVETDEIFEGRGKSKHKIGYTKKIKITDKVRALEMLAKHFKLLTDVQEIGGIKGGEPLVVLTMPANGSEKPGDNG